MPFGNSPQSVTQRGRRPAIPLGAPASPRGKTRPPALVLTTAASVGVGRSPVSRLFTVGVCRCADRVLLAAAARARLRTGFGAHACHAAKRSRRSERPGVVHLLGGASRGDADVRSGRQGRGGCPLDFACARASREAPPQAPVARRHRFAAVVRASWLPNRLGRSRGVHEATCSSRGQSPQEAFPTRAVSGRPLQPCRSGLRSPERKRSAGRTGPRVFDEFPKVLMSCAHPAP